MANKVLLISEKHIKNLTAIELNADAEILSPIIINIQRTQLEAILGKQLYDSLLEEVEKLITIPDYEMQPVLKTLLDDYVKPFLCYAVVCDFMVLNNFKLSNKGTTKAGETASSNDVEYGKNYYDNYLATYKSKLIQYLRDNKLLVSGTDTNTTSYAIGWFLDNDCNSISTSTTPTINPFVETDPHWNAEKNAYYTKVEIDNVLDNLPVATLQNVTENGNTTDQAVVINNRIEINNQENYTQPTAGTVFGYLSIQPNYIIVAASDVDAESNIKSQALYTSADGTHVFNSTTTDGYTSDLTIGENFILNTNGLAQITSGSNAGLLAQYGTTKVGDYNSNSNGSNIIINDGDQNISYSCYGAGHIFSGSVTLNDYLTLYATVVDGIGNEPIESGQTLISNDDAKLVYKNTRHVVNVINMMDGDGMNAIIGQNIIKRGDGGDEIDGVYLRLPNNVSNGDICYFAFVPNCLNCTLSTGWDTEETSENHINNPVYGTPGGAGGSFAYQYFNNEWYKVQ
jgi:hypothetical protein